MDAIITDYAFAPPSYLRPSIVAFSLPYVFYIYRDAEELLREPTQSLSFLLIISFQRCRRKIDAAAMFPMLFMSIIYSS